MKLYLHDIPRPIDAAALNALREALGNLPRGEAWNYIERFTSGDEVILGETDDTSSLEALTSLLSAAGYVVGTEPPSTLSEPENGSELNYEESVAMAALAVMRSSGGNPVTAMQNVALLVNATGERSDEPDIFYDAGVLIARTFDIESQLHIIDAIGKMAGLDGIR